MGTMGLGTASEYSRIRVPWPPQNSTTFIGLPLAAQGLLGRPLAAQERLVSPDVRPVSVTPAVPDAHVVQVAVYGLERVGPLQVEDHVRVLDVDRVLEQDLVRLA